MKSKLSLLLGLGAVVTGVLAVAASAAPPANTAAPTISGTPKVGSTLTANDGSWTNSPTSYTYQWQRCASDGRACGDIVAGTSRTYSPTNGDVGHALRVVVTAVNAEGRAAATSSPTAPVDSANGPANTVRPALAGSAVIGGTLRVTNGSWSPTPNSYGRQWQRCDSDGTGCVNIAGATGQTYGVRLADVGHRIRALVTARTSSGNTTVASAPSSVVAAVGGTTTVVTTTTTTTTTTTPSNRAPALAFLSLRVKGARAYVRFRVCDDRNGRITIIARDNKARYLAVTHRFRVALVASCEVWSKSWRLAPKFRTRGKYVATLRAVDAQGRLSLLRSRSVRFR